MVVDPFLAILVIVIVFIVGFLVGRWQALRPQKAKNKAAVQEEEPQIMTPPVVLDRAFLEARAQRRPAAPTPAEPPSDSAGPSSDAL